MFGMQKPEEAWDFLIFGHCVCNAHAGVHAGQSGADYRDANRTCDYNHQREAHVAEQSITQVFHHVAYRGAGGGCGPDARDHCVFGVFSGIGGIEPGIGAEILKKIQKVPG